MEIICKIRKIINHDFFIIFLIIVSSCLLFSLENNINPPGFLNIDELLWIKRADIYIDHLKNIDFIGGIQTVHPGITVMLLSGLSVYSSSVFLGNEYRYAFWGINLNRILVFFDLPIVLIMTFSIFLFYYLLRKLAVAKSLSFLIIMFVCSNIFLVNETTPVDKLAVVSIILSLFSVLVYVNGGYQIKKYLLFASFMAAFGVLSKLSVLIVVPYDILVLLYYSPLSKGGNRVIAKEIFLYILSFFASFAIIFPGILIDPIGAVNRVRGAGNNELVSFFADSGKHVSLIEKLQYYSVSFFSGAIGPLEIGLFLFFIVFFAGRIIEKGLRNDFSRPNLFNKNILILLIFAIVYFIYSIIFTNFLFSRYIAPVFVIVSIFSAIGFYEFFLILKKKFQGNVFFNHLGVKLVLFYYLVKLTQICLIYFSSRSN